MDRLRQLASAALDITATLALDERTQRIARQAREVVGARQAVVWVAPQGDDDPLLGASGADDLAPAVALALRHLPRLADDDDRLRHPLRIGGRAVDGDPRLGVMAALLGGAARGWLSVPLFAHEGRAMGLVVVTNKRVTLRARDPREFSAADERILVQFARLAASALEDAALFENIRAANALRDAALFMVTHDLKQPLTVIKANVQMLQRQARRADHLPSEHVLERLVTIDETADQMTQQINELLDLARLQAGQPLELERQPVELVAFVQQLANEQRQMSARHTIVVAAEVAALHGIWDAPRVARAVSNLLSNAVKYSPKGGEVLLRIRREEPHLDATDGPWAVVSVSDHGLGIPRADLPHIFEPFHRASNVVHGNIPGSGIGLASTYHVVAQHGGALTVESRLGAGTTFTLRLPLDPPADA